MKRVKKSLSGILAVAMLAASMGGLAHAAGLVQMKAADINAKTLTLNTDSADIFTVGGEKYIMLDSMDDGSYFIMGYDSYGIANYSTDGTTGKQKYEPGNAKSIGKYVSETVWGGTGTRILPEAIKSHVLNTTWPTEPGTSTGGPSANASTEYSFEAFIAPISATEFLKYYDKIGVIDEVGGAWTTRTADVTWNANNHHCVICLVPGTGSASAGRWALTGSFRVRPVMYIDRDFFMEETIDLLTLGDNVKDVIVADYDREDLSATYTANELDLIFGSDSENKPVLNSVTINGTGDTTTTVTVEPNYGENAVSAIYQWQLSTNGTTFTDISGQTADSLYVTSAYASTNGESAVAANNNVTRYLRVKAIPVSAQSIYGDPVYSDVKQMPVGLGPKKHKIAAIAKTDDKYVFTVGDRKFILVNAEADGSYFVMAHEIYSNNIAFDADKTQRYNPADSNNIGYYVENTLWNGGANLALPQVVKNHAMMKTWRTEKGTNGGNANSDYTFDAQITLISATEWEKYKDIIGIDDENGKSWWTRTASGTYETDSSYNSIIGFRPTVAMESSAADSNWPGLAIRPVMYLDRAFFTEAKVNVYTVGDVVKSIMKTKYTESELAAAGYTPAELDILFDRQTVVKPEISSVTISGKGLPGVELTSAVTYDENTVSVRYQWQVSADGNSFISISGATADKFRLTASQGNQYVRLSAIPVDDIGVSGDTVYSESIKIAAALSRQKADEIAKLDLKLMTDDADIFSIGSKKFIMLDSNDDGEFFIMTYNSYGSRVFDPDSTQKYDISDTNNIAHYVTNDVWNGNGSMILPEKMKNHAVIKTWRTEAGTTTGNASQEYVFDAKLALISATEFLKYKHIIGIEDEMTAWATRTADVNWDAANHNCVICFAKNATTGVWSTGRWALTGSFAVRPVMYLDREFFKDEVVPAEKLGANVIKVLKEVYSIAELQSLYSKNDLYTYFGISDYGLQNAEVTASTATTKTISVDVVAKTVTNPLLIVAVYDASGETLKGITSETITTADGSVPKTLTVTASDMQATDIVKIMLWDGWRSIVPLCGDVIVSN